MNDDHEFFRLVATMRCKQREYFQRPITPRLLAAKAAEKEVDAYIDKARGVQEFNFVEPLPADEIPY